jgi:peptide/nickel transport system substrate-binding protein
MKRTGLMRFVGVLAAVSMVLAACQTTPTTAPTAVVEEPTEAAPMEATATEAAPTEVTPAEETPTEVPTAEQTTRKGGWFDEIDFSVVDSESALTQIQAGAIDLYTDPLASAELPAIEQSGLSYSGQNGLYYNLLFNPAEFSDGRLNPFHDHKIREAINYLVDRDYINQEIYGGGSLAKFFAITTQFPDYADLAETARTLEAQYAFNPEKAKEIITTEMEGLGATLVDDKWTYNDEPVSLIFVIRSDSDGTRKPIGDYVSNQLESVGFTVDRQYKTSTEATPLWIQSEPTEGKWSIYTAAWSAVRIDRDQKTIFQEMYLPESAQGLSVFTANDPDPAFSDLANKLARGNFTTVEERHNMMAQALELSMQDSLSLWLIDGKTFVPYANNVEITADLAAGVQGAEIWPNTARFKDQEGGTLKAAASDLFTEPWNPIAGSNWAWDQMVIRGIGSADLMYDPFTGLLHPYRVEKIDLTVEQGLPVTQTLDWLTLTEAQQIDVPADAWVDWDATKQEFIPASEKFPDGETAKVAIKVTYPSDMFQTVKWHDGSNLDVADFVMSMIMSFDRGKPESAIYDEVYKPSLESFLATFKGFKIESTDPFVLTYYTDSVSIDAEWTAGAGVGNSSIFWPAYTEGEGSWSEIAVANLAEAAGELAYSADKATEKEIEQTSFVGGPSLDILAKYLDGAIADSTIPYAATMSQYLTADQAKARYENLKSFYVAHGNFWAGTGPYVLDHAYTTEKNLVLKNNPDYADMADRWAGYAEPKIAVAEIDGPGQITIGEEATFDVYVTFKDEPYAASDIKQVKYLLYNAKNEIVSVDYASLVADGQYSIVLPADVTSKLEAGANKLEVAVVPLAVSIPTFTSVDFVTNP